MNSHDRRYIARFLVTSRVALGLYAHADAGPNEAQSGAANRQRQPATSCLLTEMRLSASQREKVFAVLEAHVPVIRARMKAARRAQPRLRSHEGEPDHPWAPTAAPAYSDGHSEIVRLRERAMRELRTILTPYQCVQLDRRTHPQRRTV